MESTFRPPPKPIELRCDHILVDGRMSSLPRSGFRARTLQASMSLKGQLNSFRCGLPLRDIKLLCLEKVIDSDDEIQHSSPTTRHSPAIVQLTATEDSLKKSASVARVQLGRTSNDYFVALNL